MTNLSFQAIQLFKTNSLNGAPMTLETTFTLKKKTPRQPVFTSPDEPNRTGSGQAKTGSEPVQAEGMPPSSSSSSSSMINLSENPLQSLHFHPDRSNYDSMLVIKKSGFSNLIQDVNRDANGLMRKNNNSAMNCLKSLLSMMWISRTRFSMMLMLLALFQLPFL